MKILKEQLKSIHFTEKIKFKIEGTCDIKAQYHYTMETQTCIAIPKETEIDLYPSTQWPAALQEVVSDVLKLPQNK